MAQILEQAADQFLVFGVSLPPDGYGVVKNDMVNTMRDDAELLRLADARALASRAVLQGRLLARHRASDDIVRAGRLGPLPLPLPATDPDHARRQD